MNAVWQVQEAKNRLSEVIDKAVSEGPQTVTRHGKPIVTIAAVQDGRSGAATAMAPNRDGFSSFLLSMPKTGLPGGLPAMPRRNRRRPLKLGE